MDNVTHSLVGLVVGEALAVKTKKARVPLWTASAIGNNLPDLDVLLTFTLLPGKANYLLHHRGHSHTLIVGILLAALSFFLWRGLGRQKKDMPWKEIGLLLFLGVCLHIFADYWNSYGVHPFWPLDSSWYYGDIFFIIEPWIWIVVLPMVFFTADSRWGKGISALLATLMLGLAWFHPVVPTAIATTLSAFFVGQVILNQSMGRAARVSWSIACLVGMMVSFTAVRREIKERFAQFPSDSQLTSLALSPYPGNPFCWNVIRSSLSAQKYQAEVFTTSIGTSISFCPDWVDPKSLTAPLLPMEGTNLKNVRLKGKFTASRESWEALSKTCMGDAILRFSRSPFWIQTGEKWIVGDLRFDREKGYGFSEWEFDSSTPCPSWVPPWKGKFHPGLLAISGK